MVRVAPPYDTSPTWAILSSTTSTSARNSPSAVTTVPPRMSVASISHPRLAMNLVVGLGAPIAEELPGVADLVDHRQIEVGDHELVVVLRALHQRAPAR